MSVTTSTSIPLTRQSVQQQVEQVSTVYQLSKFFSDSQDPHAIARSGMFSADEQAQLAWIAKNPDVQADLEKYQNAKLEFIRLDKATVRMDGEGFQGTQEQLDARLDSISMRESLDGVTANIFGAIGGGLAANWYPDDPEMQAKYIGTWKALGEVALTTGEVSSAAREHIVNEQFDQLLRRGVPGQKLKSEKLIDPNPRGIPEGGKTFDKNEVEKEGSEAPEGSETEQNQNNPDGPDAGAQYYGPEDPAQNDGGYSVQEPNASEPNQSFPMDNGPNQSFPEETNQSFPGDQSFEQNNQDEPNQSFPEDPFPNQGSTMGPNETFPEDQPGMQGTEDGPNQSFPQDPVQNQSLPQEPNQSFPEDPFPNQGEPAQSFPEDPIMNQSTPEPPIQTAPIEPPIEYSAPSTPVQSFEPAPTQSFQPEPAPIQSAPIEPIASEPMPAPEPMSSPEPMQSTMPDFEPGQ